MADSEVFTTEDNEYYNDYQMKRKQQRKLAQRRHVDIVVETTTEHLHDNLIETYTNAVPNALEEKTEDPKEGEEFKNILTQPKPAISDNVQNSAAEGIISDAKHSCPSLELKVIVEGTTEPSLHIQTEVDSSYNGYKEKQRNKPPKSIPRWHEEETNPSKLGWYQRVVNSFPSPLLLNSNIESFSRRDVFSANTLIGASTCVLLLWLMCKFRGLRKSIFDQSPRNPSSPEDEQERGGLTSSKLERITKKIFTVNAEYAEEAEDHPSSSLSRFARTFTQREMQLQHLQVIAKQESFIIGLKYILKDFLAQNPLRDLSNPNILLQTIVKDDESNEFTSPTTTSTKKRQWKKENFEEIEKIEHSISILERYYKDIITIQKRNLLQSSSSSASSSVALSSLLHKAEELFNIKEILHLYYRYLIVTLKQLTYYMNYHESFRIYKIIHHLESYLVAYNQQNKLFEQHMIQDLLYNQGILKTFQTHHKCSNASDTSYLLPNLLQRIDTIIQDYYEGKRLEIEQEENENQRQLVSSLISTSPSMRPPHNKKIENILNHGTIMMTEEDVIFAESSVVVSSPNSPPFSSSAVQVLQTQQQQLQQYQQQAALPTNQLIQFFNQQNCQKRIHQLKSEKERLLGDNYTRSHAAFLTMINEQKDQESRLERDLTESQEKYDNEIKKVDEVVLDLKNQLYHQQQTRNDSIFTLLSIACLVLMVTRSIDCTICEGKSGGVLNCYGAVMSLLQKDGGRKYLSNCFFQTIERICVRLNQDHFPSFFPGVLSSSTAASSSSWSIYSTIAQVFIFVNPLSTEKWSYFFTFLKPFLMRLVSFEFSYQVFSPYFQILYTLAMLFLRYLPIFFHKKVLPWFGIPWHSTATHFTSTQHIHHHYHATSSATKQHTDWASSLIAAHLSSLSFFQFYKYLLYLYCYGDIMYNIFSSFFQLLFIPILVHLLFYRLFDAYALQLICLKRNEDYCCFYLLYLGCCVGIVITFSQ